MIKKTLILLLVVVLTSCSSSNKVANKSETKQKESQEVTPLHVYDGEELPKTELAQVLTEFTDSTYMYFISVDDNKIKSPSLINGVKEIFLKPGKHSLRVRFVSKGRLAIPLKSFSKMNFKKGKSYTVKSKIVYGTGDYIAVAKTTKITVWIEESGSKKKYASMTVNGFGK